jgi:hypothetical protein
MTGVMSGTGSASAATTSGRLTIAGNAIDT